MFSIPQGTRDSKTMEKKLEEMCGVRCGLTFRLSRSVRGGNPCRIANCDSDHQNVPGIPFISILVCNCHAEGSPIVLGGEFRIQITKRAKFLRHICVSCSLHATASDRLNGF